MTPEIKAGSPPQRQVKCPVHNLTSTYSPAEEVIDEMTFHFLRVDDCDCLYAFSVMSPEVATLQNDVSVLWDRANKLSASGDTGGVYRTKNKITAAEIRVKDKMRALWREHSHRVTGNVVGVADGLQRAT